MNLIRCGSSITQQANKKFCQKSFTISFNENRIAAKNETNTHGIIHYIQWRLTGIKFIMLAHNWKEYKTFLFWFDEGEQYGLKLLNTKYTYFFNKLQCNFLKYAFVCFEHCLKRLIETRVCSTLFLLLWGLYFVKVGNTNRPFTWCISYF